MTEVRDRVSLEVLRLDLSHQILVALFFRSLIELASLLLLARHPLVELPFVVPIGNGDVIAKQRLKRRSVLPITQDPAIGHLGERRVQRILFLAAEDRVDLPLLLLWGEAFRDHPLDLIQSCVVLGRPSNLIEVFITGRREHLLGAGCLPILDLHRLIQRHRKIHVRPRVGPRHPDIGGKDALGQVLPNKQLPADISVRHEQSRLTVSRGFDEPNPTIPGGVLQPHLLIVHVNDQVVFCSSERDLVLHPVEQGRRGRLLVFGAGVLSPVAPREDFHPGFFLSRDRLVESRMTRAFKN